MYMTVGDLKKALENVSDECEVRYQRIEDVYFDKNGWEPKKLLFNCYGQYHYLFDENGNVIKDENDDPIKTDEHCDDCYSDYVEVFSAYKHPEDNVFVLNAHY